MDFKHLKKTDQGYLFHMWFAIRWGCFLILTGIISILHGLFPFLMPFEAPRRVMRVAKMILLRNHKDEIPPEDQDFWKGRH